MEHDTRRYFRLFASASMRRDTPFVTAFWARRFGTYSAACQLRAAAIAAAEPSEGAI
jgi:hypothetical protein